MVRIPSGLPSGLEDEAAWPRAYRFRWSVAERTVWRRRKWMEPSKWAPRHMVIPTGPFEGARYSHDVSPHLAGIMDAAVQSYVREIVLCAAPQTGKTTLALTVFAWFSIYDPGPALSVYPNEATGAENMRERIQPSYRQSPQLRSLITGRREDEGKRLLRLRTMYHRIAWAGSLSALANRSIKLLNLDEVDKYDDRPSKEETGTVELAKIRTRAYRNHKIFLLSSPSVPSGQIWHAIHECSAVFVYWVRCQHCTTEQLMDFDQERFRWPHGEDGRSVDRRRILEQRLARYVCHHCGAEWDDDDRDRAVRRGVWRQVTADLDKNPYDAEQEPGETLARVLVARRPRSIGFLSPSWISHFVSLSEVAHDFLKSQDEDLPPEERFKAYQNFQNKHRSLPWRRQVEARKSETILALRDDRPMGLVPGMRQVSGLVAGVDTQDNGFFFAIVAIGYGLTAQCWLVRHGFVHSFEDLAQVLWLDQYRDAAGNRYHVQLAIQDAMGHRTADVYDFCRRGRGQILPSQGKRELASPYSWSDIEYWPGTTKKFPAGLKRINVNTTYYKDMLSARLGVSVGDPGGIVLHGDVDEDFAAQLCAEYRDMRGHWEQIGSRPNHYWDCMVLALCAADVLGLRYRPRPVNDERGGNDGRDQRRDGNPYTGGRSLFGR